MKALVNYFHPLERIKRQRKHYLNTVQLPQYLADLVDQPCPALNELASDLDYLVLDFETTGLDSDVDLILSMGWVEMKKGKVDLATANHVFINTESQIRPETAVINHITPQMLSDGVAIHDAMTAFFDTAKGKILVAHGCMIETNFIIQYLKAHYGLHQLPLLWLDTLCIEKHLGEAINQEALDVTLSATRTRYGLPEYNGHNALIDAVATAELLLAQQKRLVNKNNVSFSQLFKLSQ